MGATGRGHLGAVEARSSLHSQCTAAHPTTNVHALKEKPTNPTWLLWGSEGDMASWGSQCFGEPGPPQLWSCCRGDSRDWSCWWALQVLLQHVSGEQQLLQPPHLQVLAKPKRHQILGV